MAQIMTRAKLAKRAAWRVPSNAHHVNVMGPILLSRMDSGRFDLSYCTKGTGCTVAILDTNDDATIQAAIDKWIDGVNYDMETGLRRRAEDVRSYGNEKRAAELHAEAEQVRAKRLAYTANRRAA